MHVFLHTSSSWVRFLFVSCRVGGMPRRALTVGCFPSDVVSQTAFVSAVHNLGAVVGGQVSKKWQDVGCFGSILHQMRLYSPTVKSEGEEHLLRGESG